MLLLGIIFFFGFSSAVDVHVASSTNTVFSTPDYQCTGTNDQTQIQTAINYVRANGGGSILFSNGIFMLSSNLYLYSNMILQGQGMDATILKLADNSPAFSKAGFLRTINCINLEIRDMTLDGNKHLSTNDLTSYGRFGIYTEACNYTTFNQVRTSNWYGYGFDPHGTGGTTVASYYVTVSNCEAINNGWDGITIDKCINSYVFNNRAIGNGRHGINIVTGSKFGEFHDNYICDNGYDYKGTKVGCGIMIQNNQGYTTQNHVLYNNELTNSSKGGLCLTDVSDVNFNNNKILSTATCLRVKNITDISADNIAIVDNICGGRALYSDSPGYVGIIPSYLPVISSRTEYVVAAAGSASTADFYCTGATDERTIMQAITYLGTSGGTVTLTAGIFNINMNIILSSNIVLRGAGMDVTVLRLQNNASPWKVGSVSSAGLLRGYLNNDIIIKDLTIDGNRAGQPNDQTYNYGKYGFYCETCNNVQILNVKIKSNVGYGFDPHGTQSLNTYSNGLLISNCISEDNGWDGYTIDQTLNVVIENSIARNNGRHGINIVTGSKHITITNNVVDGNGFFYYSGTLGCGITYQNNGFFGTSNITARQNTVTNSATSSICVRDTDNTQFIQNIINGTSNCIYYTDSAYTYLESNTCLNRKNIKVVSPYSNVVTVNQTNVVYS